MNENTIGIKVFGIAGIGKTTISQLLEKFFKEQGFTNIVRRDDDPSFENEMIDRNLKIILNKNEVPAIDIQVIQLQKRLGPSLYKTAFISGHLDLTEEEFKEHYVPLIKSAMEHGDYFVVGDAKGTDTMAQKYLDDRGYSDTSDPMVTLFHMFQIPRNEHVASRLQGGYQNDEDRDAAMTRNSDYDIAWVRPGREKSGTAKNIDRRSKLENK